MRHAISPSPPSDRRHRRSGAAGFTLIELMIAVVVVGILAAVAFPSFMNSMRQSRRSDAFAALSAMQQAQERRRSNNPNYSTSLSELGITSPTAAGYYTLSAPTAPPSPATLATGYIVTATAVSGTTQASDGDCVKLSVRVTNGTIAYGSCSSCSEFTYAASDRCWAR